MSFRFADASFTGPITPSIDEYRMSEDYVLFGHPTNSSTYASANFDAPEEVSFFEPMPGSAEIQPLISQTFTSHLAEMSPPKPAVNMSTWRKQLRESMLQQTEKVLDFLVRPVKEHQVLGPVESLLRKYSVRKEVDQAAVKPLADLLTSGSSEEEINTCLQTSGPSTLSELRSQVSSLIELYKKTGESILDGEYQLTMRVEKLGKLHKQVSSVLELQVNDETEGLLKGMEKYLQASARDLQIESLYKDLLHLYSKHMALRETIQLVKTGTCLPSEPWCSICLSDTISYAIVPCGHTFCVGCSRKMVYDCGMCRAKIKERLKIYIS